MTAALHPLRAWYRAWHLRAARHHIRVARRMLARGDDAGTIIAIGRLVAAAEARSIARREFEAPAS